MSVVKVAGASYHSDAVNSVSTGDKIHLREQDNTSLAFYTTDGELLGFVSKDDRKKVEKIMEHKHNAVIHKKLEWEKDGIQMPTGLRVKLEKQ